MRSKFEKLFIEKLKLLKASETKASHRMSIDVGCAFLVVIDLLQEYTIPDLIAFGKQGYLEMIEDLEKNL